MLALESDGVVDDRREPRLLHQQPKRGPRPQLGERGRLQLALRDLDGQTRRNRQLGRPLAPKLRPLGAIRGDGSLRSSAEGSLKPPAAVRGGQLSVVASCGSTETATLRTLRDVGDGELGAKSTGRPAVLRRLRLLRGARRETRDARREDSPS